MIMELLKSLKRYKSFIVIELRILVTPITRNERLAHCDAVKGEKKSK